MEDNINYVVNNITIVSEGRDTNSVQVIMMYNINRYYDLQWGSHLEKDIRV